MDFIKEIKSYKKILDMQKNIENGKLHEKDLTEEEKKNVMELYNQQIKDLKQDIECYNKILNSYKEKIMKKCSRKS